MATVDELMAKSKLKVIKKGIEENKNMEKVEDQENKPFNYRPWNFMEEMDRQDALQAGNESAIIATQLRHNPDTTPTQLPHNCHTTPTQLPHQSPHNCHTIATQKYTSRNAIWAF